MKTQFSILISSPCAYLSRNRIYDKVLDHERFSPRLCHLIGVRSSGCPIKPRPNDRNMSTQHIATLLAQYLQAPAKRSQHFDATI